MCVNRRGVGAGRLTASRLNSSCVSLIPFSTHVDHLFVEYNLQRVATIRGELGLLTHSAQARHEVPSPAAVGGDVPLLVNCPEHLGLRV